MEAHPAVMFPEGRQIAHHTDDGVCRPALCQITASDALAIFGGDKVEYLQCTLKAQRVAHCASSP